MKTKLIPDTSFIVLLKKHTDIDTDFINTFFSKFKIGEELNFHIKDSTIADYLGVTLHNLRKRLLNQFSKNKIFFEKVDFIKVQTGVTSGVTYMVNYPCFERLAMSGDSEQSETVRMYFIKLRQFLVENQKLIYQAIENKRDINKFTGFESIYFFVVDETKPNILKIGRTIDIVRRLRNYNVGRIKEVELNYYALVKNNKLIEKCMKAKLKNNQYLNNKEIYQIEPKAIKQIIDDCYCNNVNKKENKALYKEISDLLGLYSYTKDKKNIQPYIIIGKNL